MALYNLNDIPCRPGIPWIWHSFDAVWRCRHLDVGYVARVNVVRLNVVRVNVVAAFLHFVVAAAAAGVSSVPPGRPLISNGQKM